MHLTHMSTKRENHSGVLVFTRVSVFYGNATENITQEKIRKLIAITTKFNSIPFISALIGEKQKE